MKIVIVGAGKVGSALVRQLAAGNSVTVIDRDRRLIESIVNTCDVMAVCGNGASYEVQREAEVDKADLLIATVSNDEVNILACLVAKKLGVRHTIARVRNPEYEKQLRFMREEMGLSMSINPEKATAREIARVLRFPAAMKMESFSKGRLELVEYRVPEGSVLIGTKLYDLYGNTKSRILVCAVSRGDETIIPTGDFTIAMGDKIYITAAPDQLAQFFRHIGQFRSSAENVMIVGASKMCYYLASELLRMGMKVKILDRDEQACRTISDMLPKALVIVGDGTDTNLLLEEGIEQLDAFVALSGVDEANILMSMSAARQSGEACKVIAKINRQSLVDLVAQESMIDTVVSASSVTTELIVRYVRAMQSASGGKVKTLHRLVDGAVEALEFTITEDVDFVDVPLKDLGPRIKDNVLLAGIVRRSGEIIIPSGKDSLMVGDDVIVVTTTPNLQDISEIIK